MFARLSAIDNPLLEALLVCAKFAVRVQNADGRQQEGRKESA
jgi:hypothetical protein